MFSVLNIWRVKSDRLFLWLSTFLQTDLNVNSQSDLKGNERERDEAWHFDAMPNATIYFAVKLRESCIAAWTVGFHSQFFPLVRRTATRKQRCYRLYRDPGCRPIIRSWRVSAWFKLSHARTARKRERERGAIAWRFNLWRGCTHTHTYIYECMHQ